jgi:hypothetical protein
LRARCATADCRRPDSLAMEVAIELRLQRRRDVDLREDAEPFARESLDGSRTCLAEGRRPLVVGQRG